MTFEETLKKKTQQVNDLLRSYLPKEEGKAKNLAQMINYSMEAGGKRLRPMLMMETWRLFRMADSEPDQTIGAFMAAIEMIHTHSLIHDDLPAIDNDLYRRGKKTTHAVYGEDMAILAGDALLNYAYETAFMAFQTDADPVRIGRALQVLSEKTGIYGMLGGQTMDVKNDGEPLDQDTLDYIYANKTSALIEGAMMVGAILAGATEDEVFLLESVGYRVGLAFQIQDDILDVTSTTETLGKPVHSDEKNHKTTYVTLHGIETAKDKVRQLSAEALEIMEELDGTNMFLTDLIQYLITREK